MRGSRCCPRAGYSNASATPPSRLLRRLTRSSALSSSNKEFTKHAIWGLAAARVICDRRRDSTGGTSETHRELNCLVGGRARGNVAFEGFGGIRSSRSRRRTRTLEDVLRLVELVALATRPRASVISCLASCFFAAGDSGISGSNDRLYGVSQTPPSALQVSRLRDNCSTCLGSATLTPDDKWTSTMAHPGSTPRTPWLLPPALRRRGHRWMGRSGRCRRNRSAVVAS